MIASRREFRDAGHVVTETGVLGLTGVAGVCALVAEAGALRHSEVCDARRLLHAEAQLGASNGRD